MRDILFSLVHATGRPEGWQNACRRFNLAADNPERCEYVLGIHRRQQELPGEQPEFSEYYQDCVATLRMSWNNNWVISINPGDPTVVQNGNIAATCSSGKILLGIADSLRPCPHWDTELLKVIPDLDKPYLIQTSHGSYLPDTWIVTHSIQTRVLYQQRGYMAWPEYTHYGLDDDITLMAQRDGVIIDARHLNFPYYHWSNGLRLPDKLTKHTSRPGVWQVKEEVLKKRIATNFVGKVRYGCVPE